MLDGTWELLVPPVAASQNGQAKCSWRRDFPSEAVKSWHLGWYLGLVCNLSLKAEDSKVSPDFSNHFEA